MTHDAAFQAELPAGAAGAEALCRRNLALLAEVQHHRRAAELARGQSEMLIQSLNFLAAEADLDSFLGYVLKVTVQQLDGVGGTLWFPDPPRDSIRLHLEYVDSRIVRASASQHPAVTHPLPVGGRPVSTFPTARAETYVLSGAVDGMPEENRAYIQSLGVRSLLTVPMTLGEETVGWICVRSAMEEPRELEDKLYLAEALAGQATLAVQMARLTERARQAAALEERNRIARDIHDTLAQGFTGVILNLEAASRTLRKDNLEKALEHIDLARNLAQAGLAEARQSVAALRPEALRDADLVRALHALVDRCASAGTVQIHFQCVGPTRALPSEIDNELLRIAQEGMTNTLKHARARHLDLRLEFRDGVVLLSLTDDGAGFDPDAHHDGFGLLGMRERAERIGARLEVRSRPGSGTQVRTVLSVGGAHHA